MLCSVCAVGNPDQAVTCRSCGSPLSAQEATLPEQAIPSGTVLQGGAFVVDGILGQGGFGITYKGRDTTLNRTVAIKEFFPQAQGCVRRGTTVHPSGGITLVEFQEERTKFLEEGQRLAQFQHGSIVRVFSLFEQNNTAYMVMEFLKGKTLLTMVEESGPLDEQLAVQLVEQVAGALEVVHKENIIHRDIKPENVIVTTDRRAVLIDFGTAREFAVGRTRNMTTMLTPGYAPLEQYGQRARFGGFTDIYALGATTYYLLTGQTPIQATDRAAGVELAAPRRLSSRISSQASDAIMWAMEMRVDKRPQSASEFAQAVRGTRSPPSNGSTMGSTPTPRFIFIGLSVCIIGVFVAVSLLNAPQPVAPHKRHTDAQAVPEPAPPRPEPAVPEFREPQEPDDFVAQGLAWFRKSEYDRAIADFTEAIRLNPQYVQAYDNRGLTWYYRGDYHRAIADSTEAIRLNPQYVQAYNNRGLAWFGKEEYVRAIADFTEAIRLNPLYVQAYNNRGLASYGKRQYDFAIADFIHAIRINPQYTNAYYNRGLAWFGKEEYDRAITDFTEVIRLNPQYAQAYYMGGLARFYKGQLELAIADFSEAIHINPQYVDAYWRRAAAWRALSNSDAAIADEDQARRLNAR